MGYSAVGATGFQSVRFSASLVQSVGFCALYACWCRASYAEV